MAQVWPCLWLSAAANGSWTESLSHWGDLKVWPRIHHVEATLASEACMEMANVAAQALDGAMKCYESNWQPVWSLLSTCPP